jgi:hypothetical protein
MWLRGVPVRARRCSSVPRPTPFEDVRTGKMWTRTRRRRRSRCCFSGRARGGQGRSRSLERARAATSAIDGGDHDPIEAHPTPMPRTYVVAAASTCRRISWAATDQAFMRALCSMYSGRCAVALVSPDSMHPRMMKTNVFPYRPCNAWTEPTSDRVLASQVS